MSKKKLATVWLGGCSGCHMSLLDIDERLLELLKLVDIVKSPIVDTKEFPGVDVALVEGAITSDEHLHEIHNIRKKTKILVAFGDCAVTANVPSLRNPIPMKDVLSRAYIEAESVDKGQIPCDDAILKLLPRVMPLHEAVKVDVFIPGCPPSADLIFYVLSELVNGRIPVLDKERLRYG
jgi:NAD-reducing hydrogenase small subunit